MRWLAMPKPPSETDKRSVEFIADVQVARRRAQELLDTEDVEIEEWEHGETFWDVRARLLAPRPVEGSMLNAAPVAIVLIALLGLAYLLWGRP